MSLKDAIGKYTLENGLNAKMKERNITIDKIVDYVIKEAKNELDGKDGAIDDKTIFGWVVHYIEDAYKGKEPAKVVTNEKKEEYTQLSLFGGDL